MWKFGWDCFPEKLKIWRFHYFAGDGRDYRDKPDFHKELETLQKLQKLHAL